jgi:hypothetical protein
LDCNRSAELAERAKHPIVAIKRKPPDVPELPNRAHTGFRAVGHYKGGKQLLNTSAGFVPTVVRNELIVHGRLTVEALMDLRKRVDEMLLKRRAEIEKQLESMEAIAAST